MTDTDTALRALEEISQMVPGSVPLPMTEEEYLRTMLWECVKRARAALAAASPPPLGEAFPGAFVCPACQAGRHRECGTFDCHCGYRASPPPLSHIGSAVEAAVRNHFRTGCEDTPVEQCARVVRLDVESRLGGIVMADKRIRADVCPVCGGTVLAPESVKAHVRDGHPETILPNGGTVDEALARLDAERAADPWQAGWNAAVRWMERER